MKNLKDLSNDLKKRFNEKNLKGIIKMKLVEEGERDCDHARQNGEYQNRSGTLRSAFMYRVSDGGEVVAEGGYQNVQGSEPQTVDPQTLALQALDEQDAMGKGLRLTFVNGADYAKYVEDKGRNVTRATIEYMKSNLKNIFD